MRKGIILAGGTGSRLFPCTISTSKQLLPIFDKPMIYYPLGTLMLSKIREVMIITNTENIDLYKKLLSDGKNLGMKISYKSQDKPSGIAEALIIAKKFLNNSPSVLILGDNIFIGSNFSKILNSANKRKNSTIFSFKVKDPKKYGVVCLTKKGLPIKIIEKPKQNISDHAITGLYFYDKNAPKYAETIKPSRRGELEITDLNKIYLKKKKLNIEKLPNAFAWFDAGSYNGLLEASMYVKSIQERQNMMISCIEEIALHNKWIKKKAIKKRSDELKNSGYSEYLKKL
jgi:glucose-1-phosphate thymidylyltransferase